MRERDEFKREVTKWIKAELPPWTYLYVEAYGEPSSTKN